MLEKWSQGSEWSALLELVSSQFFDVLPARELQREVRMLARNYANRSRHAAVRTRLGGLLEHSGLPVWLREGRALAEGEPVMDRGQAVLRLYFLQLMSSPETLLDLRHQRFRDTGRGLQWDPAPLYIRWDTTFLDSVRRLYVAF